MKFSYTPRIHTWAWLLMRRSIFTGKKTGERVNLFHPVSYSG